MNTFQPRYPITELLTFAKDYGDTKLDEAVIDAGCRARERGHLTRDEFLLIGDWKSARARPRRERNDAAFVEETTRLALSTSSERLRVEVLRILDGVEWPTASVILHLAHREPYPILDVRALWSLGLDQPPTEYGFEFWWSYVRTCRELAARADVDMRTLDRALWGCSAAQEGRIAPASVARPNGDSVLLAGADGCPSGWLCITRDRATGAINSGIHANARDLFSQRPTPALLCIDIPIGLPDRGPRDADLHARATLAPHRSSSVFPCPIRPALDATDYAEASAANRSIDGKGISQQAFAIYPKIRDVDEALRADPSLRDRVREVHPEVCFWAWNGGRPMPYAKKTPEGHADRRALIDTHFGPHAFDKVRAAHPRKREASDDDIADAFAALWTAERVHAGTARTLPESVPFDRFGLRMEMCC